MKTNALIYPSSFILALTVVAMPLAGAAEMKDAPMAHKVDMPMMKFTKLVATIRPVDDGSVKGTAVFEKTADGVKVTAKVGGLMPGEHGFHIHQFGDLGSDGGTSAGGHFNPDGNPHALPEIAKRHAGDLGNLVADSDGNATLVLIVKNINLDCGPHGILGRAVIVHAQKDDGGQPTGNAGTRIGAGVIGISKDSTQTRAMSSGDMGKSQPASEGAVSPKT